MLTAGGMVCCRSASRRIAVVWFLQVPIDRRKLSGHDETVKMEFAKTMTPRASAASPIDFVLAAGTVRVPEDLISCYDFSRIDSRGRLRSSPG